jgi:hypothetical protein
VEGSYSTGVEGEERFSSNSGNDEARRALTREGEDSGDARTEFGAEEGLLQWKAGEVDVGSVGKRVRGSGVDG